jgi:dipeptidyl aminopeptidase/acylaminoacyl peptidase
MLPIVATVCVVLGCLPAEKKAFSIEDLYRVKNVGAARISPDGKTIAYTVTVSDLPAGKRTTQLYAIGADGKNMRQLTSAGTKNEEPAWSPDGSQIAFVSNRSGKPQLCLIPIAGGEARELTAISTGVSNPVWSPDGSLIAFATDVYPECSADDAAAKKAAERREKGWLKAHIADTLLYRHWTSWKDGMRSHVFVIEVTTKKVRDLTPGDFDAPPFKLGGPTDYDFSPDGKELCYVSNHDPDQASSTNADLWTVPVSGGEAKNLTADNRGYDGTPRYSPDGRFIAFLRQATPGYESDRFVLTLLDLRSGAARVASNTHDNWVDSFAWLPDSRHLIFSGPVKGRVPLLELDGEKGTIELKLEFAMIDDFDLARDGSYVALVRRSVSDPTELYRSELTSPSPVRLTFENAALCEEVDMRPAETIEVAGADGAPVQVFLVKPHGFDPAKKYPLILNVHGGPQTQWADAFRGDWQVYPGAGYVVAFPNPHGSTGFGQAYTAAISGDWTGKVMQDIEAVSAALEKLPFVDADRMGAMGWSWGGYAMMWLEGHSSRFKCLAAMMGVYDLTAMFGATEELWFPRWDLRGEPWSNPDLYTKMSPATYVKAFKTPCLVITGERDYRVPYTQSLEFFTALQEMKVPSRLIVFENAGHWPAWHEMALYYNAHLEWFQRYLGGGKAPWDSTALIRNAVFDKD